MTKDFTAEEKEELDLATEMLFFEHTEELARLSDVEGVYCQSTSKKVPYGYDG